MKLNKEIFNEYFKYQSSSVLVKYLYEDNQNQTDMIVKYHNESLIDLGDSINSKEIPKNENPKKWPVLLKTYSTLINNIKVRNIQVCFCDL